MNDGYGSFVYILAAGLSTCLPKDSFNRPDVLKKFLSNNKLAGMKHAWQFRGLFWVCVLCMPATLLTGILLLNVANPMAMAFLTDFEISNESGERVSITPVGAVGGRGHRQPLPFSLSSSFSIPSPFDRSFSLQPGQRRSFTYDWDDIQFSEILVVPALGDAREVVVDSNPTDRQYRRVATNLFVIPQLEDLPVARAEVREVLNRHRRFGIFWGIVLFGLLPPIGLTYSIIKLKGANKSLQPTAATPGS